MTAKDIDAILTETGNKKEERETKLLNEKVALGLFNRISNGEGNFWADIHQPFTAKQISRETVVRVIEEARQHGADTMPRLAEALRACDPLSDEPPEKKRFLKFKNFLYKTVRLNQPG